MTTTSVNVLTQEQKEEQREEIAKHIKEYLAKGGKITQCPPNAFTEIDVEGKKKFQKLIQPDSLTDPTNRSVGGFVLHKRGRE